MAAIPFVRRARRIAAMGRSYKGQSSMHGLIRHPLLHFALIGGLLFVLDRTQTAPDAEIEPAPIEVSGAQIEHLRASWGRDSGRAPTDAELQASIRRHVDDEILVREALGRGLDRSDPVARERLLRNMRFLYPDRRAGDDALLSEASALGLGHADPVVRRRLMQVMERRLVSAVPLDAAALAAYRDRHAARYRTPARISFRQIFLRDDGTHADAHATLELQRVRLNRGEFDTAIVADAFALGAAFASWTAPQIGARFGPAVSDALLQAPQDAWIGPVRSVYGWHLLRVTARSAAGDGIAPERQAQLVRAWQEEARAAQLREELRRLRARYRVVGLPPRADGGAA